MSGSFEKKKYIVNRRNLPDNYPTHYLTKDFCEALGRAVATFGSLEDVLGRAIFALTGSCEYPQEQVAAELERWQGTLVKALSDPLGSLINSYGKAIKEHPASTIGSADLDAFLDTLREAARRRNVICHGSWAKPNESGASLPKFCTPKGLVFATPIDVGHLCQLQKHVVDLICNVVDTVTLMGVQFPGSTGPGKPVWQPNR